MRKTDYHIHPNYSIDATPVTIEAYCAKAVKLNLDEICFTTHLDLDPARREQDSFVLVNGKRHSSYDLTWLDHYFTEIREAQEAFKPTLGVKIGVEVEYVPGQERVIESILNNYPFDFVLGAVHCVNHMNISAKQESALFFQNSTLEDIRRDYFNTLMAAVEAGLFDSIAHVDLYLRYGLLHFGPRVLTVHRGVIEPIFTEMARRGMGLEINTSSCRRGLKDFHPTRELLGLAADAGIEVFTVGSDAHALHELGDQIDAALALLAEFKLTNHIFTQRQAFPYPQYPSGFDPHF